MLSMFCKAEGPGMMDWIIYTEETPETRDYELKQAHYVAHTTPFHAYELWSWFFDVQGC